MRKTNNIEDFAYKGEHFIYRKEGYFRRPIGATTYLPITAISFTRTKKKALKHKSDGLVNIDEPVAYEWWNITTGNSYVDYIEHVGRTEKEGYTKLPLYY